MSPFEITFDFYRHAQSEVNRRTDIIGGRSNFTPLTPLGLRQADALGEYLRESGSYTTKRAGGPTI